MTLVTISKQQLQDTRDEGWDALLDEVHFFCNKHGIAVLNMEDRFVTWGRSKRNVEKITNLHHYRVEIFYSVIDMQLQELNSRFNEVNTELLICMACLSPNDSFSAFDKQKLIRLAEFYPRDFSEVELLTLDFELDTYVNDVKFDDRFSELKSISDLAQKLVETKKDFVYPLVYMLSKLCLILPIATASVERSFSSMNIVKNELRNRMGGCWMDDCLVTNIEKTVCQKVENDKIIERYQNMRTRKEQL